MAILLKNYCGTIFVKEYSLKISRDSRIYEKAWTQVVTSQYFDPSYFFEDRNS